MIDPGALPFPASSALPHHNQWSLTRLPKALRFPGKFWNYRNRYFFNHFMMKHFKHTAKLKDVYHKHFNIHYLDSSIHALALLNKGPPLSSVTFHGLERTVLVCVCWGRQGEGGSVPSPFWEVLWVCNSNTTAVTNKPLTSYWYKWTDVCAIPSVARSTPNPS